MHINIIYIVVGEALRTGTWKGLTHCWGFAGCKNKLPHKNRRPERGHRNGLEGAVWQHMRRLGPLPSDNISSGSGANATGLFWMRFQLTTSLPQDSRPHILTWCCVLGPTFRACQAPASGCETLASGRQLRHRSVPKARSGCGTGSWCRDGSWCCEPSCSSLP